MPVSTKRGVLLLTLPYASIVPALHARRLVSMLAPNCEPLFWLGDTRLDPGCQPGHVQSIGRLPSLHRRQDISPVVWSVLLWMVKLGSILVQALWAVWQTKGQVKVIVCFLDVFFCPVLWFGKLLGKKIVFWEPSGAITAERTFVRKYSWGRVWVTLRAWSRRSIRRLSDRLVVESLKEVEAGELEAQCSKVRALPQYVDAERFRPITPLGERLFSAGYVGRLVEIKGIEALLQALSGLPENGCRYLLVGDGDLRPKVEQALRTPRLAHTRFSGWIAESELPRILNQLRLLVLPSAGEGIPNILLEAMACGTPVLVSPAGGIPDLIAHGRTGFMLEDISPESIRAGIEYALAHPDLEGIAERSRQLILERFSLAAAEKRWGALLDEVMICG